VNNVKMGSLSPSSYRKPALLDCTPAASLASVGMAHSTHSTYSALLLGRESKKRPRASSSPLDAPQSSSSSSSTGVEAATA
jgi:hypothetical protein